ncbi:MAG TPA: phosphotransferase [Streptomyces sp.]|uniref:phosphotransferase n=1 Tax=Streptomyces sp. TaxID=1931 RepID=UPI002D4A44BB|nr:phosphotransferase [Streptomyces sp.]HZG02160.1 phosphotransferase [Streptomyces sp.]
MSRPSAFQGHHRIWHVVPGPDGRGRVKLNEPRQGVLWFDRRCFRSEEELLVELNRRRMSYIPSARRLDGGGPVVQDYIEGRVLTELSPVGTRIAGTHLAQIMRRFRELASVRAGDITAPRRCTPRERPGDRQSSAFLRTLIDFTHRHCYLKRLPEYGGLFERLRIPPDVLRPGSRLWSEAGELTPRPFCLIHGDLHRANFIVDAADRLWTIDWELAMIGDPLYDLATHLYLMGYPPSQEGEVVERWRAAVDAVLPGAGAAAGEDLPRYLAYKRVQSVYTDVVRQAQKLADTEPADREDQLRRTAKTVHRVLHRAADVLGLGAVPGPGEIEEAYAAFGGPRAP